MINVPEPMPTPGDGPAIWDLVIADMRERDRIGTKKYGMRLAAGDGRDSLVDAYQESLDKTVYLKKAIIEQRALEAELLDALKKAADYSLEFAALIAEGNPGGSEIAKKIRSAKGTQDFSNLITFRSHAEECGQTGEASAHRAHRKAVLQEVIDWLESTCLLKSLRSAESEDNDPDSLPHQGQEPA